MSFKKFTRGFVKTFKFIRNKFKSLLNKLRFGQKISISLSSGKLNEEFDAGHRALLGFYSEYICAVYLSEKLKNSGFKVIDNNIVSEANEYKKKLTTVDHQQVKKTEDFGKELGKSIFEDIIKVEDIQLIEQFDIKRTGVPGFRADITVVVKKRDESDVYNLIEASLKSLSGNSFTIFSSTVNGFIWKVIYGKEGNSNNDIITKKEGNVIEYSDMAKQSYVNGDTTNLEKYRSLLSDEVVKIINKYGKDNVFIENFKHKSELNFEAKDVYLVIGKTKVQRVINSNNSKQFKTLVEKVNGGIVITAKKTSNLGFTICVNNSKTGNEIIGYNCGWGVTSSRSGIQKLNIMGSAKKQFEG